MQLLEMVIGKRPTDSMFEGGCSIINFVERNFRDQVLHIIDPHLQEECKNFIKSNGGNRKRGLSMRAVCCENIALACTRPFPRERMNMREVAINLHAIRKTCCSAKVKGGRGSLDLVLSLNAIGIKMANWA